MKGASEIQTTGHLRTMLANAVKAVAQGTMEISKAEAMHKLAKNITESLYSETKIAMFSHQIEKPVEPLGALPLGDPNNN